MSDFWIESAPSDEITVNEIKDEDETKNNSKAFKTTIVNSGSRVGVTQVSVKVNAISAKMGPAPNNGRVAPDGLPPSSSSLSAGHVRQPVFPLWSNFTHFVHRTIQTGVVSLSVHAARNPKSYVIGSIVISVALIATGFCTNFEINTDEQVIYAPFHTRTKEHSDWIKNESGFPGNVRIFSMNIHADGNNILNADYIRQVFEVVDEVRSTPEYYNVCSQGDYVNFDGITTCKIMGITRFFKHDVTRFDKIYEEGGEEAIIRVISADAYENFTPVDTEMIMGNLVRDEETGLITSIQSYRVFFFLANVEGVKDLEGLILARTYQLRQEWQLDDSPLTLEVFAMRSYSDEFERAIQKDLFLLPIVFFLMSGFTCLVFFRPDRVQSRTMLGIGSVVTIVLSLMSSFGMMFIIGVPFTSMTQILPFVIFGVGLDDTFIITGYYFRTDPNKDPVERIRETMEEVGLSITITSVTTMFAFILSCMSSIPAIYWLNLYAFPTIFIDFIFQITFFIALLVLDERRLQANRMDCCICLKVTSKAEDWDNGITAAPRKQTKTPPERFMEWYAKQLLRPWVKVMVVVGFIGYTAYCIFSTTLLTQEFDFRDLLPADSYVKDFLYSMETYSSRILGIGVYFRGDFNQLDPEMQQQMKNYVDELSALPQLSKEIPFCWFLDLEEFKNSSLGQSAGLQNMTRQEQIDYAFTIPAIQETYGKHVVFDENGTITASRCFTYLENIDLKVVKEQIQFFSDQNEVSARQPINQGVDTWPFFTYDNLYFIWEFYSIAVDELIYTTISGVVAVCGIGFFFFPHWKAILFLCPFIMMLYINLLGTIQWAGMHINAVTYVCLVISIGLLVDFIVHVLLRYYESKEKTRDDKVRDTLETMGASILVGGLSTALGVLPLSLSTSEIMSTVFISFFAMIVLGVTYGLVFLPVVLSICGPLPHFDTDLLDGTKDLVLKKVGDSDTDESDDSSNEGERVKKDDSQPSQQGIEQELSDKSHEQELELSGKSREQEELSNEKGRPGSGIVLASFSSYDSYYSRHDNGSPVRVLHSSTTVREEDLEVVQWNPTMAWI